MPVYDFKCSHCGHQFEDTILMAESTTKCPKCGKKADKQFTPCANLLCTFRDGTQTVNRHLYQMNKKMEQRQDSQGYGPYVDRKRAETRRKPAPKNETELTPKQAVKEYKKIRQRKKLY